MIPQFEPYFSGKEKRYLIDCIDKAWVTAGKKVDEFSGRIAEICGVKYAIPCNNGTVALFVSLRAHGIKEGDKVIVPDFTHVATANAVILAGATPVFCDIDSSTLCISPEAIDHILASSDKIRAIIPVGMYGNTFNIDEVKEMASSHNIQVIHDAAQTLGVRYRGIPVQSYTVTSTLSFYGDKVITCGEGGMVLTNDDDMAHKAKLAIHHGSEKMGTYYHEAIGWNFRMTDLQGAMGLGQLEVIDEIIRLKREHEELYREMLEDLVTFQTIEADCEAVPFRHIVFVDRVEELQKHLVEKGIQTRRLFYPLHMQPCYSYLKDRNVYLGSIWAYEHGLSLPSSAKLKNNEIKFVCGEIRKFYEG